MARLALGGARAMLADLSTHRRSKMLRAPSLAWVALATVLHWASPVPAQELDFVSERQELVRKIERAASAYGPATGMPTIDRRVLDAFAKVPRHRFVPQPLVAFAYEDMPLPLGHDQNLTQPSLLALMTQALQVKQGDRVFETGTDTGYQAAILAEIGAQVFSMEIVKPLLDLAKELLPSLGYKGVALQLGDGYFGWAERAPYDAILVKESADDIPVALWRQLKPGGRMVIPVGPPEGVQWLTLAIKHADGRAERVRLLPVRFSPFQGGPRT